MGKSSYKIVFFFFWGEGRFFVKKEKFLALTTKKTVYLQFEKIDQKSLKLKNT